MKQTTVENQLPGNETEINIVKATLSNTTAIACFQPI